MNAGLKALKSSGKKGQEAYNNIMKYMSEGGRPGILFGTREKIEDEEGNVIGKLRNNSKLRELISGSKGKISLGKGGRFYKFGGKMYEDGGVGDPPKLTQEESALLDVLRRATATPGVEVTGSTASPALRAGLGYTTAVDATAAPIKGFIAPSGEERPDEPAATVAPERVSPLAPRQPGPIPIKIKTEIIPPGKQGREVMPDQYAPGMVFDPKMRGQQRPRAMYQYDYDAGSYKERPIEIEELAHYLYSQQIPGAEGVKMRDGKYVKVDAYPTIEDAARVAERLLSGDPSLGRGRANMPPGYGYGGKMMK